MAKASANKSAASDSASSTHHNPEANQRATSFFEFWPSWAMYAPVVAQWVLLSLRYRSITLPFIANPKLTLSGMVGVPKSELMERATGRCNDAILNWVKHVVSCDDPEAQSKQWIKLAEQQKIQLPFVCKPDIGCRGSGVKLIHTEQQLADVIKVYPEGTALLTQQLSSWEPEVGIFYVKSPQTGQGSVVSLTFKNNPEVIGDGQHTVKQLVKLDRRANQRQSLYYERHKDRWNTVLAKGERLKLVFSASHCKGAVFTDAREHITAELTQVIDHMMGELPEFNYGRLDVKYRNVNDLKSGEHLEIIEINGASAESIHIWDKNASFIDAIKTLLWQYRTLFQMGAYQRKKGYKPPGLRFFLKHWMKERRLAKHYPTTD